MPLSPELPLAAVLDVVRGAVMVLFVLSSLLVILVVLMQEGKGGGLAGAFGGAGAETFGVKAGTVNKFTAWLAAAFLGLALLHAGLSTAGTAPPSDLDVEQFESAPNDGDQPADGAPAGSGPKPGGQDGADEDAGGGGAGEGDAGDGDAGDGNAGGGDAGDGDAGDGTDREER